MKDLPLSKVGDTFEEPVSRGPTSQEKGKVAAVLLEGPSGM